MIIMKRKTLGYILLIIGILIAFSGHLYCLSLPVKMYACPANGCDPRALAAINAAEDEVNNICNIISGVGISISIIGIVILVRSRVST